MIAERFSGNRKVIETDTVYLFDQLDDLVLDFMFKERNFDVTVRCTYDFLNNPTEMRICVSGKELDVKIKTNAKNRTIGTEEPIKIATVGEKEIYMHAWMYNVCGSVVKAEYTVYSADA